MGDNASNSGSFPENHELTLKLSKGEKEKDSSSNANFFHNDNIDTPDLCASKNVGGLIPSMDCLSENNSELRRRRDDLHYPPRYPDLHKASFPAVRNADNQIDISPMDFGFVSDSDDSDDTDEFHEKPR